jgi:beta-N-acetylhexosaminidase
MEMKAIQDTFGTAEGALLGLKAGLDMIMISHSYELQLQTIERIAKAVDDGEIVESVIDDAAERILRLKSKYLSWDRETIRERVSEAVNGSEHKEISEEAYHRSVTLLQNRNDTLPF